MYHPNEPDTHENVLIKFGITDDEERVIRQAVKPYSVLRLKNRVVRGPSGSKYASTESSVRRYLELYPEHFQMYGESKLQVTGKSPADILDDYFISRGEPTDCARWFNMARCIIAIGEHEVSLMDDI